MASFFGKLFHEKKDTSTQENTHKLMVEEILSPVKGKIVALNELEDEAFASGALGAGIAIEPTEGKLYAPCDGEITTFFPTGHAIAIKTVGGAEVLIHVGMDTVRMDGDGFESKRRQNETVKKGELLLIFDLEKIKAAGLSPMTPVVVTNSEEYTGVFLTGATSVTPQELLIRVEP